MSIDDLIDVHSPAIRRRTSLALQLPQGRGGRRDQADPLKTRVHYHVINPRALLKGKKSAEAEGETASAPEQPKRHPLFLIAHARLKTGSASICQSFETGILLAAAGSDKIMNNGRYWNFQSCRRSFAASEVIDTPTITRHDAT